MSFKQLVILNSGVILLLTIVFVMFNVKTTNEIVENEIYGTLNTAMEKGEYELGRMFGNARDLNLELCASSSLQRILREAGNEGADLEALMEKAQSAAWEMGQIFSYNTRICFLSGDGEILSLSPEGELLRRKAEPGSWEASVLNAKGDFVWDYFYEEYGSYIRVSHVIFDEENWDHILGIASVNINSDYLRYVLNSVWLGNSGIAYLLDENRNPLFPYFESTNLPEALEVDVPLITSGENGKSIYLLRRIPENGYYLAGEARNVRALQQMSRQRKIIIVFASMMLCAAATAAMVLAYHISSPIMRLAQAMKEVEEGNFDVYLPVPPGQGEIAVLYRNFNGMLRIRKDLIEEIYGAQVREKEAELKALQAQINPHFLYNTLDSINWMAIKYGAEDIEEVVTDLSKMLRYSLNNGRNILKVSEELTQIRCYIKIQSMRFSNSFDTEYEVDPGAGEYCMIKLLLQPLVENAILHGFEGIERRGKLIIRVRETEGRLQFSVLNNGNKMDLERMRAVMGSSGETRSTSYGIRNVNDRLVKYYGTESQIYFSVDGEYSEAGFSIPARTEVMEHEQT